RARPLPTPSGAQPCRRADHGIFGSVVLPAGLFGPLEADHAERTRTSCPTERRSMNRCIPVILAATMVLAPSGTAGPVAGDLHGVIVRQGAFQPYKSSSLANGNFNVMTQYVDVEDTTGTPGRPDIMWLQFRWAHYEQTNNHWNK